ncbi:MAG: hypothetical protein A2857_01910 [Candidatus Levybacteria bacterium RIFCSPHIGHO2_01_FULL_36_15]|nr:MAG: hypothetical protein A2857_01910 [Candidatus Levybacteria bacterium RIFCSPHIGHO2_01_FULL_36_15]OGH38697.1 MAG: hypothetical protein A2905_02825 [Candidatus Levybacteria bacterium RIFCSPLOWO2_01_FULL_36_10]
MEEDITKEQAINKNPIPAPQKNVTPIVFLALVAIILLLLFFVKPQTNFNQQLVSHEVKLVKDFPQIPLYPNAILLDSSTVQINQQIKYLATWKSDATLQEISRWYANQLDPAGWIIQVRPADTNSSTIQEYYAQKGNLKLSMSLIRDDKQFYTKISADIYPMIAQIENEEEDEE